MDKNIDAAGNFDNLQTVEEEFLGEPGGGKKEPGSRTPRKANLIEALFTFGFLIVVMSVSIIKFKLDPHIPMFVGVIAAAGVVALTGWTRADAVASLIIVALIVPRATSLLRSAGHVLMDFTPEALDLAEVRRHVLEVNHVEEVHDLHAWTVASNLPVLTAHVVVRDECLRDGHSEGILDSLQACVAEHFPIPIEHATFQLEPAAHREHEHAC